MTKVILKSSLIVVAILGISGCGVFGQKSASLVPPSAKYQSAPLASPAYPPLAYNANMPAPKSGAQPMPPQAVNNAPLPLPAPSAAYAEPPRPRPSMNNNQGGAEDIIPNSPMLTPTNIIELSAVGMGVAPESTISPSQALALAKRAAIVDAYRQLGEKMYGIRVNAQDTVKDMVLQNSVVKTKVQALIRNAEVTETVYKDGLCQVSMQLKLDGRVWYKTLTARV